MSNTLGGAHVANYDSKISESNSLRKYIFTPFLPRSVVVYRHDDRVALRGVGRRREFKMTDDLECLECGMEVPKTLSNCPKCDANLHAQSSGRVVQLDIAHNAETIPMALGKLERAVQEAQQCRARALRLVVGRGLIRDEVLRQLSWLQHSGQLLSYDYDGANTGAILVTLRH